MIAGYTSWSGWCQETHKAEAVEISVRTSNPNPSWLSSSLKRGLLQSLLGFVFETSPGFPAICHTWWRRPTLHVASVYPILQGAQLLLLIMCREPGQPYSLVVKDANHEPQHPKFESGQPLLRLSLSPLFPVISLPSVIKGIKMLKKRTCV